MSIKSHSSSVLLKRDEKGMTLLEVVIAFTIISIFSLAALPMLTTAINASSQSSTTVSANNRVSQTIETARLLPVTCDKLEALEGTREYSDGRNNPYTVTFSLPNDCTRIATATHTPIRIVAKTVNQNKILIDLTTGVYVGGTTP